MQRVYTVERSFRLFLSVRLRTIATDNEIVVELRNKLTSDELCDNTADDELFKAVRTVEPSTARTITTIIHRPATL